MDKLHISLIILLGISILLLGFSAVRNDSLNNSFGSCVDESEEVEVWSQDLTPSHLNLLPGGMAWLQKLNGRDPNGVKGNELLCLDLCGSRCIWLGYIYKNSSVVPGYAQYGDEEVPICSCDCYIVKE